MTRIKCRYSIPYCEFPGEHTRLYHSEYWFCDDNVFCEIGHYTRPTDEELKVVNPTCIYCKYYEGEFEKEVKSYEYDEDGDLTIGRKKYYDFDIDYLEIDGRVLKGAEVEHE